MRLFYLWMLGGLFQAQSVFGAEPFASPDIFSPKSAEKETIKEKAKDLLLQYSLQQQAADRQAKKRYLYWGAWVGMPFTSLKNKQALRVREQKSRGFQFSFLGGGKLHRFMGEGSMEFFSDPEYYVTPAAQQPGVGGGERAAGVPDTTPREVQLGTTFDGMFLFVDQSRLQLFGLGGLVYFTKQSLKVIPRLGIGLFCGNDTIGLCGRLLVEGIATRYEPNHPCQWSKPVTFQLGFRYILP